ncbi:RecB family exonuclease [Planobispora takensis]|uniref:PD-(D/E)XK endonuclease-like domain-containing protein n=1 Tax=Planobispora takensis TaxID=1367882 RepID=A0A8J3STW6_9ACTN|nr:PD-(D/E)XK nuclease family protein [Planobispora takensis]GIH98901.1 hypothetical protein Pta02_09100 [Planobispora takensis]
MDQLPLEGMPRRLYSCTPSRLNTWLDCPRRYRFTYLDRPAPQRGPRWAHNSVGISVHNALAGWWREPYDRRTPAMAGILLSNGWIGDGFKDAGQSSAWRDRAREMVVDYAATLDPSHEPVGVERTVATRTSVLALSGRVDRLDQRGEELVVVDYKTGRRPMTADDARSSLALAVYAVASSRMLRRPCHRVELHHLPTGSVVEWEHTDESLGRHLSRAEEIGGEASEADERYQAWAGTGKTSRGPGSRTAASRGSGSRAARTPAEGSQGPGSHAAGAERVPPAVPPEIDALFPPRTGPLCSWCDFRAHCPDGRAAAPDKAPWDALAV